MEGTETTLENVISLMGSHKYKTLDLNSDENEAAVRDNRSNAGKGDAFAAPHTDDSDFIGFDGTYVKGYQQIDSFHQMLFDIVKGSRLIGKIRSICFVTEDVAIEIAVGRTVMTGQWDIDPDRNSSHTLVAVKRNLKLHFYRFSKFANTIHWKTRGIPRADRRTKTRAMVGI